MVSLDLKNVFLDIADCVGKDHLEHNLEADFHP